MKNFVLYLLLLIASACSLELPKDDRMKVVVADPDSFHANGMDHRTVSVTFDGEVSAGKTLTATTSLGIISPAADSAGQRTLSLKTSNGSPVEFQLYAEKTSGKGRVTIDGPGGLRAFADFELLKVSDQLKLGVSTSPIKIGGGYATLTVSILPASGNTPDDSTFRDVLVKTSLGVLSPEQSGDAKRSRTVKVSPSAPAELPLSPGDAPGTAVITAELADQLEVGTLEIDAADSSLTVTTTNTSASADGQTVVPITVAYEGPAGVHAAVTLTTTLGELNPSGTTPDARRQTTVNANAKIPVEINLAVGRVAGNAVITASTPSAASTFTTLTLNPLLPDRLSLSVVDNSVLDQTRSQSSLQATFTVAPGAGSVSIGTLVSFLACCEINSKPNECTDFVTIPSFVTDTEGRGVVNATVTLTPSGQTYAKTVASSSNVDLPMTVYAFVSNGQPPHCDAAVSGSASGVIAQDSIALSLRRAPTNSQ